MLEETERQIGKQITWKIDQTEDLTKLCLE